MVCGPRLVVNQWHINGNCHIIIASSLCHWCLLLVVIRLLAYVWIATQMEFATAPMFFWLLPAEGGLLRWKSNNKQTSKNLCVHMHTHEYVCVCACVYMCMYILMCLCVCLCVCVYVFMYVCMYLCIYVCKYVSKYIYI